MRVLLLCASVLLAACDAAGPWRDQHGQSVEAAALSQGRVLVNYWAEWCGPCRDELPELNRLAAELPVGRVLGVDYDGATGKQLRQTSERMGIAFPVLGDDFVQDFELPRPQVLPTTYLLDAEGRIVGVLQGPQHYDSLMPLMTANSDNNKEQGNE
ncbi:TlpA family protein disulfide reductase [Pseudomonas abyssi]|uniref:TlpA family protein disulfide reductase n=1 Tax=Pseudomonas abyssi TaxID=170540 RepID=UPI003C7C28EC